MPVGGFLPQTQLISFLSPYPFREENTPIWPPLALEINSVRFDFPLAVFCSLLTDATPGSPPRSDWESTFDVGIAEIEPRGGG